MPSKGSRGSSDAGKNSKFEEIQKKHLEVLKRQVSSYDDSDEEDVETDKNKVDALFRNYTGDEADVARIRQFFESGENIDCLICKFFHVRVIKNSSSNLWTFSSYNLCRHSTSENQR